MSGNAYYRGTTESAGHSPIYKMHRYFARRPHNVFRSLVDHYCPEGGLIVDCFAGGGVSLIEGLSAKRRVIAYDVNPVASFIQYAQLIDIPDERFRAIATKIQARVRSEFGTQFETKCRTCEAVAQVRWVEHAYNVVCPGCQKQTPLANANKFRTPEGKATDGQYSCVHCESKIKAASTARISSAILNLRVRCNECGSQSTSEPLPSDVENFDFCTANEDSLTSSLNLRIPDDRIPLDWDRQKEDCLHRKGFTHFRDLFTPRNRLISALYFSALEDMRHEISEDEYVFVLLAVSALLRYTNNMTFSVDGWMDGRPVAWAKHAYWTPNQFIECNPLEYFEKRIKAGISGLKDRRSRLSKSCHHGTVTEVVTGESSYSVQSASSESMDLPDNSVDLVLTDPPYGSNVQYGELCHFWSVWLKDRLPFSAKLFDLSDEILVHRKSTATDKEAKTFDDYREGLTRVFKECYRVLKPGGCLVFTFNNKNPRAWFAMIRATLDAGFDIEEHGITYQGEIEAYRDTAHQRHEGTAKGDFIYTFIKGSHNKPKLSPVERGGNQLKLSLFEDSTPNQGGAEEKYMITLIQAIRHGADEDELSDVMQRLEQPSGVLV